jgi:hypothetical protein
MAQTTSRFRLFLAALIGACLVVAAGAIGLDVMHRAGAMAPVATPAATLLSARPGAAYKAVLRIERRLAGGFAADVLEGHDTHYRATGMTVRVELDGDVAVVMGTAADVKPGAVVQVSGTVTATHGLRARQLVMLTAYVQVAR